MQVALGIAREAEGLQQRRRRAAQHLLGHQLADADHLVAVVRIRDHVGVLAKAVEHRERVRREAADAAGRLLAVESLLALRSEEHTSELQSLMRISYAVFCLNK